MNKKNLTDRELLSLFLMSGDESETDNLFGSEGDDILDLIEEAEDEEIDFREDEVPVGIELYDIGDSDSHNRKFSEISNGVLLEYETFGNYIRGFEREWGKILYVGETKDRHIEIMEEAKELGVKIEELSQLEGVMDKLTDLVEKWELLK